MKKGPKVFLVILTGLLVAGVTYSINRSYITSHTDLQPVVVAKETITPYNRITRYGLVHKVRSSIPKDAVTDLKYMKSKEWYAGQIGIGKGDIIRKSRLTDEDNNPFGQAINLKDNKVLIGIETNLIRSAGGYIKPGVTVNALVFLPATTRDQKDTVLGPENNSLLGNLLVKDVLNSQVAKPGGKGKDAVPNVVVIETSPVAAKQLVYYQELGKIYLAPTGVEVKTAFKYVEKTSQEAVPKRTPATTEPAANQPTASSGSDAAVSTSSPSATMTPDPAPSSNSSGPPARTRSR